MRSVRGTKTRGIARLRHKQGPRRGFFFFVRLEDNGARQHSILRPSSAGRKHFQSFSHIQHERTMPRWRLLLFFSLILKELCECTAPLRPSSAAPGSDSALAAVRTEERKERECRLEGGGGRRRRPDGAESEKLALIVLASHSQPPPAPSRRPAHAVRTARIARRHLTDEVGA